MRVLSDITFQRIAQLMHGAIGLSLGPNKMALVAGRLSARIHHLGLQGYDEYLRLIESDEGGDEFQTAIDLLTTNETYFFREPVHFGILARELQRTGCHQPAIWSAASSWGDEVYTLAMVLADLEVAGRIGSRWSVLGTDISDRALRTAKEAVYPEERLREVSPQQLKRWCLRGEDDCEGLVRIRPELTSHVRLGRLNLCEPIDPLGPFDAIFLRNVLIYFDQATRREVIDRVLERLRPGGLFFIGMAEGSPSCATRLEAIGPGAFRKVQSM